jgi:Domain of unknown function (DUF4126)
MEVLQTLSVALGLAALSGYSLYLTVFSTGLAIHLGWVHLAPQFSSLSVLGDPGILIVSGILFAMEFFADKIPWVDSVWDAAHTVIRPIGGAFLATRALGHTTPVFEVIVALLGGAMSFASHSLKASTRLVVNSSPEPFSNIAVSAGENVLVVGAVTLLWHYPIAVFLFLAILFALTFYFLPKIWRSTLVNLWFISRKLNQISGPGSVENLPAKLPSRYNKSFRRLTGAAEATIAWAVPCVSGKGKYLEPNRFGYLVATNESPRKVCFIIRTMVGSASRLLEIEQFKVSMERRLLFEELNLHGLGKNHRYTFKFDSGSAGLAAKVAAELEYRLEAAGSPTADITEISRATLVDQGVGSSGVAEATEGRDDTVPGGQ